MLHVPMVLGHLYEKKPNIYGVPYTNGYHKSNLGIIGNKEKREWTRLSEKATSRNISPAHGPDAICSTDLENISILIPF